MSYLLFAGDDYYPLGGANDLKGKFESEDSAVLAHDPKEYDYRGGWAHVLCLESMTIVRIFRNGAWVSV